VTFRKVASLDDLWSGEMVGLDVAGNSILLVNIDDHIYAYADECPHQKSRLSEGSLMEKNSSLRQAPLGVRCLHKGTA